jgi:hypothetical protein
LSRPASNPQPTNNSAVASINKPTTRSTTSNVCAGKKQLLLSGDVERNSDDQQDYGERDDGDERFHLQVSDLFHALINLLVQQPSSEAGRYFWRPASMMMPR